MAASIQRLPSIFVSHGLVGESLDPKRTFWQFMMKYSAEQRLLQRAKTVIIVSAHWQEREVTINVDPTPKLIHDHPSEWLFKYNFKFETNLVLAEKIKKRLEESKITVRTKKVEIDHGAWGGLFTVFDINEQAKAQKANKQHVPQIIHISLHSGMDTKFHYQLGQILSEFRDEETMIISSGATTHSFTYMHHPEYVKWSEEWENKLISVVQDKDQKVRTESLFKIKGEKMYPYINHSDEHFMPLLVALGTSEEPGKLLWLEKNMILWGSTYQFN